MSKRKQRIVVPELGKCSEAEFQSFVIDIATVLGWDLIYHVPDSRRVTKRGWPDLVLSRPECVVYIELKGYHKDGRKGQLAAEQQEWLERLISSGSTVGLFWPDDAQELVDWLSNERTGSYPRTR